MKTLLCILAVGIAFVTGCQSMGFRKGYNKAQEFYDGTSSNVHVPAYSYGFMRGWEAYKMERARRLKLDSPRLTPG